MRIDHFLPRYDIMARYETTVQASVKRTYAAARHLDMRRSTSIRMLYRLRGMPAKGLTLDGMIDTGFVLLADAAGQEIVLGLIGRFWTPSGYLEKDQEGVVENHQGAGGTRAIKKARYL